MSEVTQILSAIERGDLAAAAQLLPLVYDELRQLAAQKLAHEQPGQTLQATALVHQAYLRNTTVNFTQRIDLVLYRGDLRAFDADVVGDELADRTSSGLWPSDHGGVVTTLGVHVRPVHDPKKACPRACNQGDRHRI